MVTILLILLVLACFGGSIGYRGSPYGYGGVGLGTVLLIILIPLIVRGGI